MKTKGFALIVIIALAALCGCGGAKPSEAKPAAAPAPVPAPVVPELDAKPLLLSQAIDVLDTSSLGFREAGYTEDYFTPEHLRERVQAAYDAGIRKIYFRGTGGVAYYPNSKLRKPFKGLFPHWEHGVRTFATYDILAEYIKVAHEFGMQIYYWETPFDNCGAYHCPKGTEGYEKYGEWPMRDTSIPDEHDWEHRFAQKPPENLARPIRKIVMQAKNVPTLAADQIEILTAPHGADFTPYEKPFTVTVTPVEGKDYAALFEIGGLEITDPCVKFVGKEPKSGVSVFPDAPGAITAEYDDGTPINLFTTGGFMLFGDAAPRLTHFDVGGFQYAWGGNVTFIVRFGDFARHAIGMPEYAYKENRDRLEAIVTELYERYPELDGVTFSIRTHTLPSGGSPETVGAPLVYGYGEPVVQEFIKRYGVNPRTQDFDVDAFLKLRGEYFTQALEGVSKIVHAHGGKLECMAPIRGAGSIAHGSMYPWWGAYNIDNFFDIRTWAQKGIVDNVIMLGTKHRQDTWGPEWHEAVQRFSERLAGTQTRLSLHLLVNHSTNDRLLKLMVPLLREEKLDEVEAYEEFHMALDNVYPTYIQAVKDSGRKIAK